MNCKEIVELISAAVDNQLDEKQKLIFNEHLAVCPKCKKEYEFELSTKRLICSFYPPYSVSEKLKEQVFLKIKSFNDSNDIRKFSLSKNIKYLYFISPVALLILIFIISFRSHHNHPINLAENNLIKVVYKHFDEILDGDQELTVKTSDPKILQASFTNNIGYDIQIPYLYHCALVGGWVSEEFGKKIIHTLYKDKDEIIYCSQINFNDLVSDTNLYLDPGVIEKLKRTGKYIHREYECCSVVFWLCENQLCIFAAEMDTSKLLSHLQE